MISLTARRLLSASSLGRPDAAKTALFLCDMQEFFRGNISHYDEIVETSRHVKEMAQLLDMPIIVTEQYPKGLGHTVPELDASQYVVCEKTKFSMWTDEVAEKMKTEHPHVDS